MTHSIAHHGRPHPAHSHQALSPAEQAAAKKHEQLVNQAQRWVAQSFYGTLLKQARKSPFHSDKFEGGRGGEAFGPLLDQHLADHMVRGAGRRLPEAIARKIEAKRAYGKAGLRRKPEADSNRGLLLRSKYATANLRA